MLLYTQLSKQWYSSNEGFEHLAEYINYQITRLIESGHNADYIDEHGIIHKNLPIDHFPQLKEYEVWMEGYAATGEHQKASFVGKVYARNFAQACHILMCQSYLEYSDRTLQPDYDRYFQSSWTYEPSKLTTWGCRLFWNEHLARKAFG